MLKLNHPTPGDWTLRSETDPRWNAEGRDEHVGQFTMPEGCRKKLEELKKEFGEPPKDLAWAYMKD